MLKPISVSQLNSYVANIIGTDPVLIKLVVSGEITYYKKHSSGHIYLTLSDPDASINCTIFSNVACMLENEFSVGDKVIVSGRLSVYEKRGSYSINISTIEKEGIGDLTRNFEKTKNKLFKEGLFNDRNKLPIPKFSLKIGVITSDTGAAVKDIEKTVKGKNKYAELIIFPCLVQGEKAVASICETIDAVSSEYSDFLDCLIIGRGGGSPEDLAVFNAEEIARSIYRCRIPIISAVGHEIDYTIADFVADKRAATPTAAAEIATFNYDEVIKEIIDIKEKIIDSYIETIENKKKSCMDYVENITFVFDSILEQRKSLIDEFKIFLEENNPEKVLKKGYAIINSVNDDNLITSYKMLKDGEKYTTQFSDGKVAFMISDLERIETDEK